MLFLLGELVEVCRIEAGSTDVKSDILLRKTLEKEILKHTIQFLRNKLVKCLRSTDGKNRAKVGY